MDFASLSLEKGEAKPWRDDNWCSCVLSSLLDNSTITHDVTFKTSDGGNLSAHRVIVAAASPMFRALLYGGTKESNQTEIELPTIDTEMLKMVFTFMYTGEVNPMSDKHLDLLQAAHYFDVRVLEAMTSDIIAQSLDVHNYSRIVTIAAEKQFLYLQHHCFHFIEDNINEIIQGEEFAALPYMVVSDIMSSYNLEVRTCSLLLLNGQSNRKTTYLKKKLKKFLGRYVIH